VCLQKRSSSLVKFGLNFAVFFYGGGVQAACVDGAACVATNGEKKIVEGGYFTFKDGNNPTFGAIGAGSSLHGSGVTIEHAPFPSSLSGVEIRDGGEVFLENGSSVTSGLAVQIRGADSHFAMRDGTLTGKLALYAGSGARVTLDTVTVNEQPQGGISFGSVINVNDSQLTAHNLIVNAHEADIFGNGTLISARNSQLTLDNVSLYMRGKKSQGALSISHRKDSQTFVNNLTIDMVGEEPDNHNPWGWMGAIDLSFEHNLSGAANFSNINVTLSGISSVTGLNISNRHSEGAKGEVEFRDSHFVLSGKTVTGISASGGDLLLDNVHINIDTIQPSNPSEIYGDDYDADLQSIIYSYGTGIDASLRANITLRNSTIIAQKIFGVSVVDSASVAIDNSTITTSGRDQAHGLVFYDQGYYGHDYASLPPADSINYIEAKNHSIVAANEGSAIWAGSWLRNIVDVKDSHLSGDRLASVDHSTFDVSHRRDPNLYTSDTHASNLTINASNAQLFGGTFITSARFLSKKWKHDTWDNDAWADIAWEGDAWEYEDTETGAVLEMNLAAGTQWQIHPDSSGRTRSDVSFLSLADSHISFTAPADPLQADLYQILAIGEGELSGRTDVYKAGNNATISFNTYFNEGGALDNQFTDRLLINGDVSGITTLTVNAMAGSPGGLTSADGSYGADEGISLVQVAGQAEENSFSLAGGYVTIGNAPYRYELFAYGKDSKHGTADQSQRLVSGTGDYWDYRLQSVFQQPGGGFTDPAQELVPQASNYLVAPLALMQAGLLEVSTLHARLGDIRANIVQARADKDGEYFLTGYHGNYVYRSNLKRSQYGYDTDFRYGAAKLGGNLYGFETDQGMARFGLSVSRGNLSYQPRPMEGVEKTSFGTWNAAAYFTYADMEGFYLDAIASYGDFSSDVASQLRNQTTKIGGHSWAASLEIGKPFMIFNSEDWEMKPQAQIIYQKLDFNATYDRADDFDVALGQNQQLLLRLGNHFTRQLNNRQASIYAKLDYLHSFKTGRNVWLGNDFRIGDFGHHIEAGFGFNALRPKAATSFYGQATWQQRLNDAGFSGIRFNGGVRVQL